MSLEPAHRQLRISIRDMRQVASRSKAEFTALEAKLFWALVILAPLKFIVFLFIRGDAAVVSNPATGRVYEIVVYSRGGVAWSLWVDHADWLVNKVTTWTLYIAIAALVASIAFHRCRTSWRAKNEGQG